MKKSFQQFLFVAAVLIFGFLFGSWFFSKSNVPAENTPQSLLSILDRSVVEWELEGQTTLQVEVVNTPQSIEQGLSGRETLETDGMLFVFPQAQPRAFWMKDMRFAIDILWIRDGKIVGRVDNAQPPALGTPLSELVRYVSPEPVDMVLETLPGKIPPAQ